MPDVFTFKEVLASKVPPDTRSWSPFAKPAEKTILPPVDPGEGVSDDDSYDGDGRLIADSDPEECGCLDQEKYSRGKRQVKPQLRITVVFLLDC
jgi:hypothetical protein